MSNKINVEEIFKIGQIVWVKPCDSRVHKGKVVGFQKVGEYLPIVEILDYEPLPGETLKNAYDLHRINHYREGKHFKELDI